MLIESSMEPMPRTVTVAEFSESSLLGILDKSQEILDKVSSYHRKFNGPQVNKTSEGSDLIEDIGKEKSIKGLLEDINMTLSKTLSLLHGII